MVQPKTGFRNRSRPILGPLSPRIGRGLKQYRARKQAAPLTNNRLLTRAVLSVDHEITKSDAAKKEHKKRKEEHKMHKGNNNRHFVLFA